jgi:hypothetical protein
MKTPDTYIIIDIELPCKCEPQEFENIYREKYKAGITNGVIRSKLEGFDVVRLKRNGTFGRNVELMDSSGNLYMVRFRVQTALWEDSSGKQHYVSIFPNFIRKFTRPCLSVLEYISCNTVRGEDIFSHIDDSNNIHSCEDRMVHILETLDKKCDSEGYIYSLHADYKTISNGSIAVQGEEVCRKRFPHVFTLIIMVRKYFAMRFGGLAVAWSIFRF